MIYITITFEKIDDLDKENDDNTSIKIASHANFLRLLENSHFVFLVTN